LFLAHGEKYFKFDVFESTFNSPGVYAYITESFCEVAFVA
jgi:hypothetical protein